MKNLKPFLLMAVFLITLGSCQEVVDKSTNKIKNTDVIKATTTVFAKDVNPKNFKNLVDSKAGLLVDVRTPGEFASGHIPGALNIDWKNQDEFTRKIKAIAKDKTVLIYCHSGHRSGLAKKYLQEKGYTKIYNLETGIKGWKKAALPIEK